MGTREGEPETNASPSRGSSSASDPRPAVEMRELQKTETFVQRSHLRSVLRNRRNVSNVVKRKDSIWQEEPPCIIKYRAEHLHYYGWFPLLALHNFKAMVLSDLYLHLQGLALVGWMVALHTTGLGVPVSDLSTFLRMFGTPYAGAIFNMAMLITFILGLFVTLVVNRWTTIRTAYSKLIGATLDLCMLISAHLNSEGVDDPRTVRARTELTRLLNLGHFLVVSAADAEDRQFKPAHGMKTAIKVIGRSVTKRSKLISMMSDDDDVLWSKKARNIDFFDLVHEGLVNADEWDILKDSENNGLPRFQKVYFWTQSLLHRCMQENFVKSPQIFGMMLGKLNIIVENASQIYSTISSQQMPYPYVHLVSLVVHVYLFVCTTWYGIFLHAGFPTAEKFEGSVDNEEIVVQKGRLEISDNYWTAAWCYAFVMLANVMFQGLLDMHSLLDNPFGTHCAKFPLRAQMSGLMNATRTMLTHSDQMPAAFKDVFPASLDCSQRGGERDGGSFMAKGVAPGQVPSNVSRFADFLHPPSKKAFDYEPSLPIGGKDAAVLDVVNEDET
ncbi:unnamed protein product [Ostreobium quekettii]|uniref:Bestrophin homolog n=1 Tax=Ostreobium quekettii TaxID=121088 RepID=A0A8S1IWW6_9CHLO|nr:unnamed protein product [Ostreobium quekettii]